MKAIEDRIIIKRLTVEEVTTGGIYLQNSQNEYAQVISIGSKVTEVAVGDKVMPDWRGCVLIRHNNEEYFVVTQQNILAVI